MKKNNIKVDDNGIKYFPREDGYFSPTYERLKFLGKTCPGYSLNTDVSIEAIGVRYIAKSRAILIVGEQTFTGNAMQYLDDPIWGKSAIQVAETKAVGRALGSAGIGIELGFASLDEVSGEVVAEKPDLKRVSTEMEEELLSQINKSKQK